MNKLREFTAWPVEQVMEVARMLYALRPAMLRPKIDTKSELQWNSLAREAFDFLDKLHKACTEIAARRSATNAEYDHAEARTAEADKWSDIIPFGEAARLVTGERNTPRAESKFNKVLERLPEYVSRKEISSWRKHGVPREAAMESQALFKDKWSRIVAEQNKAKVKKRRSDKRCGAKRPEVERRLQSALMAIAEAKKRSDRVDTISRGKPYVGCRQRVHRLSAECLNVANPG